MKRIIKKLYKALIKRSGRLRRLVFRLYRAAFSDEQIPNGEYNDVFTEKATFTGFPLDYFSSILLSREERIIELKQTFYRYCHYYLDLDNPKTFNQKINWLKLNYYTKDMSTCVDKYEFKQYIAEHLGEGYTVPVYGVWENENQIDFNSLPERFVLKSTLQSDAKHIILIKDKSSVDMDRLKTVLSSWLSPQNSLVNSFCTAYKFDKPRIIAEEFLEPSNGGIVDYKFYCYNGVCRHFLVCEDRGANTKYTNYDMAFNCLMLSPNSYCPSEPFIPPEHFKEMLSIAAKLAEPFPFVRVDFYDVNGKLYVGELTFYPGGGYNTYCEDWDLKLGSYLKLPEANVSNE